MWPSKRCLRDFVTTFTYVCLLENQKLVVRKFFALKEVILYYTDKLKNGGVRRQIIRDHATRR